MAKGYNAHSDILTQTKDGRDLNQLWTDYQQALAEWNAQRSALVNFLTYPVVNPIEEIAVPGQGGDFQEASEYGEPTGIRSSVGHYSMGFPFKWYDLAARFTWQFLADASQDQVDSIQNAALEADNRLVFNAVMRRIFDNTNAYASINQNPYNVYTFWNGENTGISPAPYRANEFGPTHTHYFTTEGTFVGSDLDALIEKLTEHGYTKQNGNRLVVMVNPAEARFIRTFRFDADAAAADPANYTGPQYDFIPAVGTNMLLQRDTVLLGNQPQNTLEGFSVIGSYGDAFIVEENYIPSGYLFAFATGGEENLQNPIGIRQHANPQLQGMRLVKGPSADYPLIDSMYVRGFGVGVRHRGAGAVMQVTSNTSYTAPTQYA